MTVTRARSMSAQAVDAHIHRIPSVDSVTAAPRVPAAGYVAPVPRVTVAFAPVEHLHQTECRAANAWLVEVAQAANASVGPPRRTAVRVVKEESVTTASVTLRR